jgi:protein-S-isoprenylcysteine O-methyltransferase Ste14
VQESEGTAPRDCEVSGETRVPASAAPSFAARRHGRASAFDAARLRADPVLDRTMAKNALRVGKPVDLGADVPIFPPFALLFCFAASLAMWRMTGKRLRWLSWPVDSKWVRVAAFVGAVSVAVSVVDAAGKALRDAGSGINFVDVEGLATTFPFDATRNPMYACLLFVVTPALAVLVDSAWPLVFLPLLYAYISDIVIPAEENQLLSAFGKKYAEYAAATPRLSAMGLARTPPSL